MQTTLDQLLSKTIDERTDHLVLLRPFQHHGSKLIFLGVVLKGGLIQLRSVGLSSKVQRLQNLSPNLLGAEQVFPLHGWIGDRELFSAYAPDASRCS